jgi:hypothetical protein
MTPLLKPPLYDFAVDSKACQAKLTASQADLKDEATSQAIGFGQQPLGEGWASPVD